MKKQTNSRIAHLRAVMAEAERDMETARGNLELKEAAKRYMRAKTWLRQAEAEAAPA